jgi:ligand-binding sensor domain-containing protein
VDQLGIWWIATDQGLVKKQDTTWTVYNTSNSGIPSDYIVSVNVDPMGNVWVATPNGLGMFDRADWYVFNTDNSGLPDNFITFIVFDSFNNSKWVGTLHGGLVHWFGGNFNVYDTSNSELPSNMVTAFAFDTSHNKWVGTGNGLVYISQQGWTVYNINNSSLSDNFINSIYIDTRNRKFVATRNKLTILNDTNFVVINFQNSQLPTNYIQKVVEGIDLTKWIITPEGLVAFDGENWTLYNSSNSPLAPPINDVAVDFVNNVWVATDSGLFVKQGNLWFSYYYDSVNVPSNRFTKLLFNSSGLWVGTDSGLVLLRNGEWVRFDSLLGDKSRSLVTALSSKWVADSIGSFERVYAGLGFNGIVVFERDTIRFIDETNSPLVEIYITDIKEDQEGRLLVGTLGQGLMTYDSIWVAHNPYSGDFPDFTVKDITFDRLYNYTIVTTLTGGIWARLNDTTYEVITESNFPFYTNDFNSVYVDLSNNKWISTSHGLYVLNEDTIKPELKLKHYNIEVCQGNTFFLDFYTFYPFEPTNRFLVELSDINGNFDTTSIIGSVQSRTKRTIMCYIPKTTPAGSNYKLRIVSTNPPMISNPSGFEDRLVINYLPTPRIAGDSIICSMGVMKLWAIREGIDSETWSFVWSVEGGELLSAPTDDTVFVRFDTVNLGKVTLTAFTLNGCSDSTSKEIRVSTPPGKYLIGQARVCSGEAFIYSTTDSANIKNYWSAVNGVVEKKLADNVVIIRWGNQTPGWVILKRVNQFGCTDSVKLKVDIYPTPNANIAGPKEVMVENVSKYITSRIDNSVVNKWSVVNGLIVGSDNGDTVQVGWPSGGFGKVKLVQRTSSGCSDSSEIVVRVFEYVNMMGDTLVCENSDTYFEAVSNLGASNHWYVSGGTITSNPQNRRIWVKWGRSGVGKIKLVQWVAGTFFKDSIEKTIRIAAVPPKPFIVDSGGYLYSSSPFGNQWYFNGQIMFGDTNRTIVPLRTGYYTVKVISAPGCESEMSDPFYFISGVDDDFSLFRIYPNPTNGIIKIDILQDVQISSITIRDVYGVDLITIPSSELMTNQNIEIGELSSGTYFVVVRLADKEIVKRVVLIK